MEENVFPSGAVAPVLERGYVEARLHTDGETNVERILALQRELTQSVSNPYYVLQDPETREVLGKLGGATSPSRFQEFLDEALRAHANVIESARVDPAPVR
jgi:hypothetical protein